MKRRPVLPILAVISLFLSGSASVTFSVMRPSPVSLGTGIKRIGLLDRTLRTDRKTAILEAVVTGKTPETDVEGARRCLDGLDKVLTDSGLYEPVRLTNRLPGADLLSGFPPLLGWDTVARLCATNHADALIVLEQFVSDYVTGQTKRIRSDGGFPVEFIATGNATVRAGFRIYDPSRKTVLDEFRDSRSKRWDTSARTIQDAIDLLISRNTATGDVGFISGSEYGYRIVPAWYRITRDLYDTPRSYKEMVKATRLSQVADWQGAIEAWTEMIAKCRKEEHAGRAAYDIAVAWEVLGDLAKAREWAVRAFTEYGLKKAKTYVDILDRRALEDRQAREQTGITND